MVTPAIEGGSFHILGDTGPLAFSFGGDKGTVEEFAGTFAASGSGTGNPFGANDITFIYQIAVTAGNIDNLTTESFNIPGITLDVGQAASYAPGFSGTLTAAASASLTSDGTTLGFGFTPPDGLTSGMTSYLLIVNTNLTTFEGGVFSLQDGQTQNFQGFVPAATPEPGSLALLGTGLLGVAGMARRKFFRA